MYDSYADAVSVVEALEAERLPDHEISLVAQENARGRTVEGERRGQTQRREYQSSAWKPA